MSASAPPSSATTRYGHRVEQAAAFDVIGDRYDEAFPHKEGQITAVARLLEELPPGSRVLDVGCGTGLPTARQLVDGGHHVVGIDISARMLDLARVAMPEAVFEQRDVLDLRADDGPFDAVVAFFSLLMLPRDEIVDALGVLRDLLPSGGPLVLGMVEADLDDVPIPFIGSMIRVTGYLRDDLAEVIRSAGFEVTSVEAVSYAPLSVGPPPEVQLFVHSLRVEE